jgi:hypothetical protein
MAPSVKVIIDFMNFASLVSFMVLLHADISCKIASLRQIIIPKGSRTPAKLDLGTQGTWNCDPAGRGML